MTRTPEIGPLGLWYFTETMPAPQAAEFAQRVEELGYGALWIPETFGRDPMAHAAWLLANTDRLVVATGIANIYHRHPGAMRQAQLTLAEQSDNRFILGMGVSHAPIVQGVRNISYEKPVSTMRSYLEAMAASPYMAIEPSEAPPTLLAALGPKMLELAGTAADGAHPYWTTPEHTATAREVLGPDPWLCVEQKVVMSTDAGAARASARAALGIYADLPNYRNNWLRMGLTEADLDNGGSDKFIDATFAWGSVDAIKARIQEHFDAGATHVCLQPVNPNGQFGDLHWEALEALADLA